MMSTGMELRVTAYGDPVVRALEERVQAEYVVRYGGPDSTRMAADGFDPPTGIFLVGWAGGEPVACGGFRARGEDAEIKRMYVPEEHRGKGYARGILNALEDAARSVGYPRLILETGTGQPEALGLYASSGYQRIPGFGVYKRSPLSRCFAKSLTPLPEIADVAWRRAELHRLLEFAAASRRNDGGFAWLDERGRPDDGQPVFTWIAARMTHTFALAQLVGHQGAAAMVEHGVAALLGPLRDEEIGGWWEAVEADRPVSTAKKAYDHAFVLLAASSALSVGARGSDELFERARGIFEQRFWDERAGKVVEDWDRSWRKLDSYRGANSNMHATEALLAAHTATGDARFADQARRIALWFLDQAARLDWRMPEHFDEDWTVLPDFNHDNPTDRFLPFGSTIGHGLEWARLALHVRALDPAPQAGSPDRLLVGARRLFERATMDGWTADGSPGFVYTVDWEGQPVVRDRLHWVVAEGLAAAATLESVTAEQQYTDWQRTLWGFADSALLDRDGGSWWHQLDNDNRPTQTIWRGKPDAYHAVQALLAPGLPVRPSLLASVVASWV